VESSITAETYFTLRTRLTSRDRVELRHGINDNIIQGNHEITPS